MQRFAAAFNKISRTKFATCVAISRSVNSKGFVKPQSSVRYFATAKGKKNVAKPNPPNFSSQLAKKLGEELSYEKETYEEPESINKPLKDWTLVQIGDSIEDEEGYVIVERKFKDETICVLTSTQVLEKGMLGDEEDTDEADSRSVEDGDDDAETGDMPSAVMLMAITKPTQPYPLFVEFIIDPEGSQISRVHIGSALTNPNQELRGPAGILYTTYMTFRQAGDTPEPVLGEAAEMVSSPEFATLDPDLQTKWEKWVEERGVNEDLCVYLFDWLEHKEQKTYVNFLSAARNWITDAAPATRSMIPADPDADADADTKL